VENSNHSEAGRRGRRDWIARFYFTNYCV